MSPDSRNSKRLIFAGAAAFLVLLAIEGIVFVAFWVVDGQAFSWQRLATERRRIVGGAEQGRDPGEQRVGPRMESQVLHPYLGFVTDPGAEATREVLEAYNRRISEQGFFQPAWTEGLDEEENALRVGVFGGSVATLFAMQSQFLAEALAEHRAFADRQIIVRSFAVPGHKQPQQLLALAYFLAQGEKLDLVINLDGFNEVTLPVSKNLAQGAHPIYPMDWPLRVRDVPDPALRRRVGELAFIRSERRRRAAELSASPLRLSLSANLLWRLRDRRLDRRRAAIVQEINSAPPAGEAFLSFGPPWTDRGPEETTDFLVAIWRRSSMQMHALCADAGIRYVHVLQPNQYVPESKPMGRAERLRAVDERHVYRELVLRSYSKLQAAGAELRRSGVDFLDLTMVFAAVDDPLYIDSCCHFNILGNSILARRIANEVAEQ